MLAGTASLPVMPRQHSPQWHNPLAVVVIPSYLLYVGGSCLGT